jgi:hypothetical protein
MFHPVAAGPPRANDYPFWDFNRGFPGFELKHHDFYHAGIAGQAPTFPLVLNDIPQGAGHTERIGDVVVLVSLHVRMRVRGDLANFPTIQSRAGTSFVILVGVADDTQEENLDSANILPGDGISWAVRHTGWGVPRFQLLRREAGVMKGGYCNPSANVLGTHGVLTGELIAGDGLLNSINQVDTPMEDMVKLYDFYIPLHQTKCIVRTVEGEPKAQRTVLTFWMQADAAAGSAEELYYEIYTRVVFHE